jgi:hypothetical protein
MFVYGKHIEEFRIDKRELGGNLVAEALFTEELEFGLSGFVGTIHCLVS